MSRKYTQELLHAIKDKQYEKEVNGAQVIIKPIPDCDIPGAIDTRVLKAMKKTSLLMRFIPKSMLKMDASPKSIARLRKMFNSVDSTPIVEETISVDSYTIKASDGYEIPMKRFKSDHTLENSPVLYFIHGGGFFAGSTDVVSEALKLIVANTGIIAYGIDYRLAPENPFPRGHEDVYTGLEWIYRNCQKDGGNPDMIFVAGDSAGGNLTLYCSNRNIKEETQMIKGQILLYPTVNMGGVSDAYVDFSMDKITIYDKQRHLIAPGLEMMASMSSGLSEILGTPDTLNQELSPYLEVSEKSPITFISVGEHDSLSIETLAYARKLQHVNVPCTTSLYSGMGHAYIDQIGNYPQAEDCAIDIGQFILKNANG